MALIVRLPDGKTLRFSRTFLIGREQGCDVVLSGGQVSRRHAEVTLESGHWIVRDLQSSNGLFVNGRRTEAAPIGDGATLVLGTDGPTLRIEPESASKPQTDTDLHDEESVDAYAERYFHSEADDESAGSRTVMIRKAFQKVQQRQRRNQRLTMGVLGMLALAAIAYALYTHRVVTRQMTQAQDLFYAMKRQDVVLAELEKQLTLSGSPEQQRIAAYMAERKRMLNDYEGYAAGLYDRRLNEKERLILRVTRLFGECDVAAPPEYVGEVMRYIEKWRSTGRYESAIKRAQAAGYPPRIAAAFMAQSLPPQYFYVAMQESDFDPYRSGPPTRWGIAKGMWQFIPDTGRRFGLKIGPLAAQSGHDPSDDRFDWEKATPAAASYIKEIYSTDAQASGLLVMASYNWGEFRVIDLLKRMPADPRQRNFWKLLAQYRERLPLQTYEYVFYIVSAAVIGENPRLFGFNFDNPLGFLKQ